MIWKDLSTSSISKSLFGLFAILSLTLLSHNSLAQDTIVVSQDSVPVKQKKVKKKDLRCEAFEGDTSHSAKKAVLLSAFLPGAGQIYNNSPCRRTWWKVPIIYAGFGASIYGISFNSGEFKRYRTAYLQLQDDPLAHVGTEFEDVTEDNLLTTAEFYRRRRDLSVIALSAVYVLNLIDAAVDAHLFNFDVSNDISLQWQPYVRPYDYYASSPVTGLTFTLKL